MSNIFARRKEMAAQEIRGNKSFVRRFAADSLAVIGRNSAAFQSGAKRNGFKQRMLIVRMKTKECKITALSGQELYAGDYIECFNEKWLVVETFTDENGVLYGKAWLCNFVFKFQNGTQRVVLKDGIIDDGSYAGKNEQRIPLEEGFYRAYLPIDADTVKIFIDKRFAIGTAHTSKMKEILSVVRVVWLDKQTYNLGAGSHLLRMRLKDDVFNEQEDSVGNMICNYIKDNAQGSLFEPDTSETGDVPDRRWEIEGRDSIRIGTSRSYFARLYDDVGDDGDGAMEIEAAGEFVWTYPNISGVKYTQDGNALTVEIPLNPALVGTDIELFVVCADGDCVPGRKTVEVIA